MTEKLTKRKKPYHYTESGLNNIWLSGIYEDEDGDPVIPNPIQLHKEIAISLALLKRRLNGEEIRFLRSHIGLSGADLARKILKVSPETVSRWENNRQTMDRSTEILIRIMVLKEIEYNDYEIEDLTDLNNQAKVRLEAKFSPRGKRWNLAA